MRFAIPLTTVVAWAALALVSASPQTETTVASSGAVRTYPPEGKLMAVAEVEIEGRWMPPFLAGTLAPVEYEARAFAAGGSQLKVFGNPGDIIGAYFLPSSESDNIEMVRFVLSGKAPNPPPEDEEPDEPNTEKITAAVYVYEKDETAVPVGVSEALQELNSRGIVATEFEDDTVNGDGETPEQYRTALAAAKKHGMPCLVLLAGDEAVTLLQAPTEADAILEAVNAN